ncbi:hypothetical protein [Streptomyces sp. NBC_00258]|uniref:hypothetical protein n=1 Tax=Streptomyces sp. NBC_00258 TaxID=2903642 RepID=UPI002E2E3FA0|nr:hypothetical protein [Streptomyces sp. NBC_00258]
MGRTKNRKNKARLWRQRQHLNAAVPVPTAISWTPLKQTCGCVVDWGWSRDTANLLAFRDWYISQLGTPCTWHTSPEEGAGGGGLPDVLMMCTEPQVLLHARRATGDWCRTRGPPGSRPGQITAGHHAARRRPGGIPQLADR